MSDGNRMYINGKWCVAAEGGTLGVINPATEEVIDDVPYGGRADARIDTPRRTAGPPIRAQRCL